MKMQEIELPSPEKTEKIVKVLIYVAIAVVVFIVIKKISGLFGEDPDVKESRKKAQKDYEKAAQDILNSQSPTLNDAQLKLIADQIYEDLKYSSVDDDKADAELQLKKINNDADFIRLNDLFGVRKEWFFGIPTGSAPFIQYVTSNLSRERLDRVNQNYATKNISFRW